MRKKIELLAPAGNMEALKAAVAAGCDAVYLGGTGFSARAFAGNFDHEEMVQAITYCHIHGVKVYVTMNTLLFEQELSAAQKEVGFLYKHDVDALLIQDLGLFHWIREVYPDLELHCSTQMHIHNAAGVRFMKEQGAARAVIARETPLDVIRDCIAEGIDIEVFAYGAICISYSGQCLMSQAMKNRSGNRGMCAQLCRLRYQWSDGRNAYRDEAGEYLLSPKDLNVLDRIPELIEAGVSSLKIEGRMKRPEYVWLVIRTFREAIDAYYRGETYHPTRQRLKDLMLMFNRGFSHGHLFNASTEERMSPYRPNHMGITIGTVEQFRNGRVLVRLTDALYQHDGLRILNEPHDTGLTAVRIEKNGRLVSEAAAGDLVWLDCRSKPYPKKGQKLQKTTDSRLLERIQQEIQTGPERIPVTMKYTLVPGQPAVLTVQDQAGHIASSVSEEIVQKAKKAPLDHQRLAAAFSKTGDSHYIVTAISGESRNAFLSVSALNELRRQALDGLSGLRSVTHIRSGAKSYCLSLKPVTLPADRMLVMAERKGGELPPHCAWASPDGNHPVMPVIQEKQLPVPDHSVLSQPGDLAHAPDHFTAGMSFNCTNSYAAAFLFITGACSIILSSEMQTGHIRATLQAFAERYGFIPPFYRLVYGRRTLMYIKNGIRTKNSAKYLEDSHKKVYPLRYRKNLLEVLEPEPYRAENPVCMGSFIIFTEETPAEQKEIIGEAYEELFERI